MKYEIKSLKFEFLKFILVKEWRANFKNDEI